jgi:hypothetical protein
MKYKLYITINKLNGKLYAGKRYWTPGTSYMGSGLALKKAIEKYGKENFEVRWFKLHINTPTDLERLEIKLIRRLRKKFGYDKCYNMASGGRGGCYRSDADENRKQEVGKLISLGKKEQYKNGVTGKQLEGRRKMAQTKRELFKNEEYYKKFVDETVLKQKEARKQRRLTKGLTDKEKNRDTNLHKYSLVLVTYKLKYPDGTEIIETNTLKDFQEKYTTQDIVFSHIKKHGFMKFLQKKNISKHVFPTGTEIHYISECRWIDACKNEETRGSSAPRVSDFDVTP